MFLQDQRSSSDDGSHFPCRNDPRDGPIQPVHSPTIQNVSAPSAPFYLSFLPALGLHFCVPLHIFLRDIRSLYQIMASGTSETSVIIYKSTQRRFLRTLNILITAISMKQFQYTGCSFCML
jgi:hypothetical protein